MLFELAAENQASVADFSCTIITATDNNDDRNKRGGGKCEGPGSSGRQCDPGSPDNITKGHDELGGAAVAEGDQHGQ
jgi:hypothetical protein